MSEQFIQSQYLLQQITNQFFRNKNDMIRVKDSVDEDSYSDESQDNQESDLEKLSEDDDDDDDENNTYHFLETNQSNLHYTFDLCDDEPDILREYTVYMCGYKMIHTDTLPYLQYVLDKGGETLKFPSMQFKCATNIQVEEDAEESPQHIYFQNECSKFVFQYASPSGEESVKNMYRGYVKSSKDENVLYAFFDLTEFSLDTTPSSRYQMCIIDEIVNKHMRNSISIDSSVYSIFYQTSDVMTIKDKWGKRITIPFLLYSCEYTDGVYINTYNADDTTDTISILDDRTNDPYFGSVYVFSTRPLKSDDSNMDKIKRNVVFCINPIYILQNTRQSTSSGDGFRLSSIIPSTVDYVKNRFLTSDESDGLDGKPDSEDKPEPVTEDEEDEEDEDGSVQDEMSDVKEHSNQLKAVLDKEFSSIYFHTNIGDSRQSFWGIKSSIQFTSL
jgi:hypothetical protein